MPTVIYLLVHMGIVHMATWEQKKVIFKKLGYKPSHEQEVIHQDESRLRLVAGGERSGKSFSAAQEYLGRFWETKLLWLVAEDYARTSAEFNYICEGFEKLGIEFVATKKVDPGEILAQGGFRIVTKSASDPRKIGMEAPDGILCCESSQVDYETYLRLRGRLAEKRGWMLMSGCLSGQSLIPTSAGLKYIEELVGNRTHPIVLEVNSLAGTTTTGLAFYNGECPTIRVLFDKGFELEGTPDHKVIARLTDGSISWAELKDLKVGQCVALRYGTNLFGTKHYDLEETYLAGLYIAEGSWESTKGIRRGSGRLTFTLNDEDPWELLEKRGFVAHDHHWRKADRRLAKFFKFIGIDPKWKSHTKEIPIKIRESNRKTQVAFLRGLFDGDGTATSRGVGLRTVSLKLAKQVQAMLLNIGVLSCLTWGYYKCQYDGNKRFLVDLSIYDSERFANLVGFSIERKHQVALSKKKPKFVRNQALYGHEFLDYPVCWVRVKGKEEGFCQTYDLNVPNTHSYCANGLIVHNTFESSLGWYPELYTRWQMPNDDGGKSFSLPTWSNLAIFPDGRIDKEIKLLESSCSTEWFNERYGGVPCPPQGRVFTEFSNSYHVGIGKEYEFKPDGLVDLWVDPGYASAYSVLVAQVRGEDVYIIDEIFERGMITSDIIKVCKQRPWWNKVIGGAIDIAATQHQAMLAPAEVWLQEAGVSLRSRKMQIRDGIETVKRFLLINPLTNKARLHINAQCKGLISELGGCENPITGQTAVYQWKRDRTGAIVGEVPEDKFNHASKALAYGLVDKFGFSDSFNKRATIKFF